MELSEKDKVRYSMRPTEYGTGTISVDDRDDDSEESHLGRDQTLAPRKTATMMMITFLLVFVLLSHCLPSGILTVSPQPQQLLVPPWVLDPEQHFCVTTLILLRHAKSSWDNPSLDDFDRPLSPDGVTSAQELGQYLRNNLVPPPDCIVSSPSNRTVSTLALVTQEWFKDDPRRHYTPTDFRRELYDDASTSYTGFLMNEITDLAESSYSNACGSPPLCQRLLLVGHNPAIGALATTLVPHLTHFKTGGYCEFHLHQGWTDVLLHQQMTHNDENAAVSLGTCTTL